MKIVRAAANNQILEKKNCLDILDYLSDIPIIDKVSDIPISDHTFSSVEMIPIRSSSVTKEKQESIKVRGSM